MTAQTQKSNGSSLKPTNSPENDTKGSESSGQQRIKQHSGQSSLSGKTKVKKFLICSTKQETNEETSQPKT